MCIGVPMVVLESYGAAALCEGRGVQRQLNMLMVGDVAPGSWVLSSLGSAYQVLSDEDAALINEALDQLDAVLGGESAEHLADPGYTAAGQRIIEH